MKRALLLFTIVVSCVSQELYAQKVAVKTNLLSDAFFSPNLGVEVGFAPQVDIGRERTVQRMDAFA